MLVSSCLIGLREELSEHFQLLVTAHDRGWAHQLVHTGVVNNADVIRFGTWTPDTGPTVESGLY